MRSTLSFALALAASTMLACTAAAAPRAVHGTSNGLVYRYYAGVGYRFNPLLSFANLNRAVTQGDRSAVRRLAPALLARGRSRDGVLLWEYDFSFGGGPSPWTSGFTQVVAAQALARAGTFLDDPALMRAADSSFRAMRHGLVLHVAGGAWVREYGFTQQVILNAQLQSILSLESYAQVAHSSSATLLAADLERTTRALLPRFDLGCWARYQLDGGPADAHYQAYHVELLRQIASTHHEPIWHDTYLRWRRCSP